MVLGGGGRVTATGGASQLAKVAVLKSYPSSANVWTITGIVDANLTGGNSAQATAYALCSQ